MPIPNRSNPGTPSAKATGRPVFLHLVWCTLVLCLSIASVAGSAAASPFDTRVEALTPEQQAVWRSTVALEVWPWHHGARARGTERGSGLVVAVDREKGRLRIATAAHALACPRGCSVRVRFRGSRQAGGSEVEAELPERPARVLWRHRRSDLALLEVRFPRGFELPRGVSTARRKVVARPGDPVLAMGFPSLEKAWEAGRESAKVFSSGRLESRQEAFRASVRALAASGAETGTLEAGGVWTHTATILPGSSGGPLVSADGAVVGLNVGSLTRSGGACVRSSASKEPSAPCLHLAVDLTPLWLEVERRGFD